MSLQALIPWSPTTKLKLDEEDTLTQPEDIMSLPTKEKHKPSTTNHDYRIFILFILLNFITMAERSIIAGSSSDFSAFCASAYDAPPSVKENPDAGIGVLTACFVGGYSVAVVVSGHLVHKVRWKNLVSGGVWIWIVGVGFSGFAWWFDSFYLLVISRMASGVAEASFWVVAPPIFQDRGGEHSGLWLALYTSSTPIGFAIGYIYAAIVSMTFGWEYCFFFVCIFTIPLGIAACAIQDDVNGGMLTSDYQVDTLWNEAVTCLKSKVLLCIIVADGVQIGVITALGTFGGAMMRALELFKDQVTTAIVFSIAAATAGLLGTPIGGFVLDRIMLRQEFETPNYKLAQLLPRLAIGTLIALLFFWPTTLPGMDRFWFLAFVFFGWMFLFSIQPGIIMAIMLSVDPDHRSNAIAFSTLVKHLLGDVPTPIAFGALKDHFAPGCVIGPDGEFVDDDLCRQQKSGLLKTFAVCYAWFSLSVIFFELGHYVALQNVKKEKQLAAKSEDVGISLKDLSHPAGKFT